MLFYFTNHSFHIIIREESFLFSVFIWILDELAYGSYASSLHMSSILFYMHIKLQHILSQKKIFNKVIWYHLSFIPYLIVAYMQCGNNSENRYLHSLWRFYIGKSYTWTSWQWSIWRHYWACYHFKLNLLISYCLRYQPIKGTPFLRKSKM